MATKEKKALPALTFLVRLQGPVHGKLFVRFGGKFPDTALCIRSRAFTLAGINSKEILGVRPEVFQMDAMVLCLGFLVICVGRFGRLGKTASG